jgi:hypothetical protein
MISRIFLFFIVRAALPAAVFQGSEIIRLNGSSTHWSFRHGMC